MTAKRFTIKEFSTLDAMSSLDVICDNGIELPSSTACDLLNEQHETIQQLRKELNDCSCTIIQLQDKVDIREALLKQLEDENEQLKSENKGLQGKASSWKITASEQIMEQSELMKENEQLKQRIKVLEDTIDGLTGTIAHFDLDEVIE